MCKLKELKKPNGAKPGFVIYTGQNSIEVTPNEKDILEKEYRKKRSYQNERFFYSL